MTLHSVQLRQRESKACEGAPDLTAIDNKSPHSSSCVVEAPSGDAVLLKVTFYPPSHQGKSGTGSTRGFIRTGERG